MRVPMYIHVPICTYPYACTHMHVPICTYPYARTHMHVPSYSVTQLISFTFDKLSNNSALWIYQQNEIVIESQVTLGLPRASRGSRESSQYC
nr:MAG TPA: hypothetical protein [Caudoviricetes sp.]